VTADREPRAGETHYEVLGVPRDAERQRIARAYRAAMRRLHPDVGAAADADAADDEVFAVQEAWRVLGDPEARAAYDQELSTPEDAWSDLGWGVALDDPGPAEGDGPESAPPSAQPRPGDGDRPGEFDGSPQDEPWRTPFAPGAIRIPEPALPSGPLRRGPIDWLLIASVTVLTSVTVVAGASVRASVVQTSTFPGIPVLAAAAFVAVSFAGVLGLFLAARAEARGSEARAALLGVAGVGAVSAVVVPGTFGLAVTVLGLAALGAGVTAVWAVVRRRAAARRAEADRTNLMTAYHRSVEWNRIREALRAPGARVERSYGSPGLDHPLRVRTEDPITGETALRDLDAPLPRGAWVVVDDSGSAICTAPPGALEAWKTAWPEAGARR
jgi:hypothetical protein